MNIEFFIKDHLRVHKDYSHYPFLFSFHPEMNCQKLKEFGERLRERHFDFKNIKYYQHGDMCGLTLN
jgi:hypothetical protein